jgi:hypothetical protein
MDRERVAGEGASRERLAEKRSDLREPSLGAVFYVVMPMIGKSPVRLGATVCRCAAFGMRGGLGVHSLSGGRTPLDRAHAVSESAGH